MVNRHFEAWMERACQLAAVGLSLTAAFLLRFDFAVPSGLAPVIQRGLLIAILTKLPAFEWAGMYRGLRRFASIPDLYLVLVGNAAGSALFAAVATFWIGPKVPRSVLVIDGILCFGATTLVRFSSRIRSELFLRNRPGRERKGILIYGAGAAGAQLAREIRANPNSRYSVKGFLDDNTRKRGSIVFGAPVLGTGREACAVVRRLNQRTPVVAEIVIAMRSATGQQIRESLANCHAAHVCCKTLPRIDELLDGTVLAAQVRSLSVRDLLGRQPVKMDEALVRNSIRGRAVLITGAAGSIGSELCRQVARFGPSCLVAFDQAESDLFRIEGELRERYSGLELVAALGDIRDADRIAEVLERQSIESVFHAAAYKHVPMMESHALEAARNNILGTWNLVQVARCRQVDSLLMISSDKAVNPVCVMGATKRACERIVSARYPLGETRCASVRFGNVLASNGSVVPIFQSQIAAGGPVKVTHPEARRYFMTISEAVSLTLQASSLSQGSEIFVLDMGEPMRIVELAEHMIRLAGKVPYEDIDIQFTGLRPGEKLIEAINRENEGMLTTGQEKMRLIREEPLEWGEVADWIAGLEEVISRRQEDMVREHLRMLVPEYQPASELAAPSRGGQVVPGDFVPVQACRLPRNGHGAECHADSNGSDRRVQAQGAPPPITHGE